MGKRLYKETTTQGGTIRDNITQEDTTPYKRGITRKKTIQGRTIQRGEVIRELCMKVSSYIRKGHEVMP